MSKCYLIRLQESVSVGTSVTASDTMTHRIEVTNVLTEKEMKKLLAEELEKQGWEEISDRVYKKKSENNGIELVWDLEKGEVTASLAQDKEVVHETVVTIHSHSERGAQKELKRRKKAEQDRVEAAAETVQRKMQKQISNLLGDSEEERRKQLNQILEKVYGEALKRKAMTLGNVMSIDESIEGDDYELIIRVVDGA